MNSSRLIPIGAIKKHVFTLALMSVVTFQSVVIADTSYGPVRPGETLSSIVNENYVLSPYPDQVIMREIFRNNPQAFISNNMGLLKQGVKLTLPSDTSIGAAVSLLPRANVQSQLRAATVRSVSSEQSANRQEIKTLQQTLASVRAERDRLNNRIATLQKEAVSLTARVSQLESANSGLQADLKAADEALKAARAEHLKAKELAETALLQEQQASKTALIESEKNNQAALLEAQESAKGVSSESSSQSRLNAETAGSNQAALLAERDQKIKSLESSIAALEKSKAEEMIALTNALDAMNAEQQALQAKLGSLSGSAGGVDDQIAQLKAKNESLVVELAESRSAYDQLLEKGSTKDITTSSDAVVNNASESGEGVITSGADNNASKVSAPFDITKLDAQTISTQLEKPVTFPLWGALLGALALGLTTLLMLLARGRAKKAVAVAPVVNRDADIAEASDDVVFRAADPERIEPDIETLRVPPRTDPSRVAILDPTMSDTHQSAVEESLDIPSGSHQNEDGSTEAALKLAMAEAYSEIGDVQAANELLLEVQQEGSQKQSASAQILINRLVG